MNSTPPIFDSLGAPAPASLVANTTYYAELGSEHFSTGAIQWVWDAAIILTSITYESTCVPRDTLFTYAAAAGGWDAEGDIATITAAGGTADSAKTKLEGVGVPRLRAIIVVGATGGVLTPYQTWKAA